MSYKFTIDTRNWINNIVEVELPNQDVMFLVGNGPFIETIFNIDVVTGCDLGMLNQYIAEKLACKPSDVLVQSILALIKIIIT